MNGRDASLAIGVFAALAGLSMVYVPSVAAVVDSPTSVPFLISVVALVAAIVRGREWLRHDERAHAPAERERPTAVGVPGDGFDTTLERAPPMGSASGRGGADTRRVKLRQSLRDAGIETLVTFQGYTDEEARRAIDRGTWTDDRYAVEFFTTPTGTGTSVTDSVRGTFYGEGPFNRRARAAATEIERLGRGEEA